MAGKRIGELLVDAGRISAAQLEEALHSQVIFGGRLGTNLVDLDLLSIVHLGQALSRQRGVPEARPEDFLRATSRLLDQFPRELAVKHKVFPLRLQQKTLHLAMIDPHDVKQIDEVTFVAGSRVKPYVAPELRLLFFLEQRLGVVREKRFVRVLAADEAPVPHRSYLEPTVAVAPAHDGETLFGEEAPRATVSPSPASPAPPAPPAAPGRSSTVVNYRAVPPPAAARPAAPQAASASAADLELVYLDDVPRGAAPVDDFEITVDDRLPPAPRPATATPLAVVTAAAAASLDHGPTGPGAVFAALATAGDRDAVARLLVQPMLAQPTLRILFLVRGEMAVALIAQGTPLSTEEVRGLVLPLTSSAYFQRAYATPEMVVGPARGDPLQLVISGYMHAAAPEVSCVVPVKVGKRVVNLLCVQTPAGAVLAAGAADELARLGEQGSAAYTRLIRAVKGKA